MEKENNNLKSPKEKALVILLAFLLGTFGGHRFYLRHYWRGILSILFFWTFLPTIISFIDIIIFAAMDGEKFDLKYNNPDLRNCPACNCHLTFFKTPTFGFAKLKDGEQLCLDCFHLLSNIEPGFGFYSSRAYDRKMVEAIIEDRKNKIDDLTDTLNNLFNLNSNDSQARTNKKQALKNTKNSENETLESVINELNALTGLTEVKSEINTLVNFIKIQNERKKSGLESPSLSYHIVFTGNPGTGKTTVARIVAKIYKHLSILTEGHLVETDRSGLVAEYVGQTAVKVNRTVDSALNGILFIDEAYALTGLNNDDYGREAVATLIKRMEDDRDKLVLIVAGYTKEMTDFIESNPGFQSRFNRFINFPDFSSEELFQIFENKCRESEYHLTEGAKVKLKTILEDAYTTRDKSFGNGRFVRNMFEKTLEQQANRIAKENNMDKEILSTITEDDISEVDVLVS